jgi:hypothetical protein
MHASASLIAFGLLLSQTVYAESFDTAYDITLPVTLAKPQAVFVDVSDIEDLRPITLLRLINNDRAVPFEWIDDRIYVMQDAIFDAVPTAAQLPGGDNTVDALRDGNYSTYFQPVAADSFRFRFHFNEPIHPAILQYDMNSADVKGVTVRIGDNFSNLHDAYVGSAGNEFIELSGETARAFEVTFTMNQGVPRIAEMNLLQSRQRILFRGVPNQRYTLLSGNVGLLSLPKDEALSKLDHTNPVIATISAGRGTKEAEQGDFDGIDVGDNCPTWWNPDQTDLDKDGIGDICDNCPRHANNDQVDKNRNNMGDICEDDDSDGHINAVDNCPQVQNNAQADEDKDGVGNVCDNDDNRFTAGKDWLLWAGMAGVILLLAGVGYMVLSRTEK